MAAHGRHDEWFRAGRPQCPDNAHEHLYAPGQPSTPGPDSDRRARSDPSRYSRRNRFLGGRRDVGDGAAHRDGQRDVMQMWDLQIGMKGQVDALQHRLEASDLSHAQRVPGRKGAAWGVN